MLSVAVKKLENPQSVPAEGQDMAAAAVDAENRDRRPEEQPRPEAGVTGPGPTLADTRGLKP